MKAEFSLLAAPTPKKHAISPAGTNKVVTSFVGWSRSRQRAGITSRLHQGIIAQCRVIVAEQRIPNIRAFLLL